MNRLRSELQRLYVPIAEVAEVTESAVLALVGPADTVRAMVLELIGPPDWATLSLVWHGVQVELDLPAPAIAVSGTDGLQLWFSLSQPIAVSQAHGFLEDLRTKFLPDIQARRLRLMPAPDASASRQERHARLVPAVQEPTGNWSAFVAPDLAPVFAETPWIDIPPSDEGQAKLLRGLATIKPAAFEAARARLSPRTHAATATSRVAQSIGDEIGDTKPTATAVASDDPRRFLLQVMNDPSVALALRIDAAKALLARG